MRALLVAFVYSLPLTLYPLPFTLHPLPFHAHQRPDTPDDVVYIDGERNPELIPVWSVWEYSFRLFGRGAKLLPATLLPHLSAEESSRLFTEADAHLKREAVLHDYIWRLEVLGARQKQAFVGERAHQATLEYRRETLRARARLLGAMRPAAQKALIDFVESKKPAIKLTVRRSDLAAFMQPE